MLVSKSRRALLRGLAIAPVAASAIASPWGDALAELHQRYEDEPATLARTKEGRSISRFRYHNTERWMTTLEADFLIEPRHAKEALHQAGFICQQALCAYLLDMGFADAWNASHIKQDIAKALAYANACGFGHDCPDMARLAAVLSPYWKWGYHYHDWEENRPRTGGFIPATITPLVRALSPCPAIVTAWRFIMAAMIFAISPALFARCRASVARTWRPTTDKPTRQGNMPSGAALALASGSRKS